MITRVSLSSIAQGMPKYRSMLAGNDYYVPPMFESIASATSNGSASFIEFTSIPSSYQHLQVRMLTGATADADYFYDLNVRFNSDAGSNYNQHWLYGDGSSVTAGGQAASYILAGQVGGSTNWGVTILDIHDYASTTKNKTIRTFNGVDRNGTGYAGLRSGLWRNTSAISTIRIYSSTLASGSTFALYGIK